MIKIDIKNNKISVWYWCDIMIGNYQIFTTVCAIIYYWDVKSVTEVLNSYLKNFILMIFKEAFKYFLFIFEV